MGERLGSAGDAGGIRVQPAGGEIPPAGGGGDEIKAGGGERLDLGLGCAKNLGDEQRVGGALPGGGEQMPPDRGGDGLRVAGVKAGNAGMLVFGDFGVPQIQRGIGVRLCQVEFEQHAEPGLVCFGEVGCVGKEDEIKAELPRLRDVFGGFDP